MNSRKLLESSRNGLRGAFTAGGVTDCRAIPLKHSSKTVTTFLVLYISFLIKKRMLRLVQ